MIARRAVLATAGLIVAAAVAPIAVAEDAPLRIGVQKERPPFSFSDTNDELHGFDVDIARVLCARLETPCELIPTEFTSLIPDLREGDIDAAVASISITEERLQLVDFTSKYYQAANRFVGRAGTPVDASAQSLAGKTIGVKRGTTHERYLTNTYGDVVTIRRYANSDEVYVDLVLGRLDLALGDAITLTESFLKTDLGAGFEFVGPALSDPRWFGNGEGIAVRKGNAQLLARLDAALGQIRADGTYLAIRERYFDYDIDGDGAALVDAGGSTAIER